MSKLYFRYGAMNSGKSAILLQVAHNYESNNKKVVIIKSSVDSKADDKISSRIGLERKVDILIDYNDSFENYKKLLLDNTACILVDEAQFLSSKQVEELWKVTKKNNIPVICYGLKTNFKSTLFEGSKRLIELADVIEELITICSCGQKAKFNSRFIDGKFSLEGNEILIDGEKNNVEYIPLCSDCYIKYMEGELK